MSKKQMKDEPGKKYDGGKPAMSLLPFEALREVAAVLTHGAKKYDANNWRKGMSWSRLQDAMLRHYTAFAERDDTDEESGCLHLAHVACCALFLLTYQITGLGKDDRPDRP